MTKEERPLVDAYLRAEANFKAAQNASITATAARDAAMRDYDNARGRLATLVQDHPGRQRLFILDGGKALLVEIRRGFGVNHDLVVDVMETS